MPEKIKPIAPTTKFSSVGEALQWSHVMMEHLACQRGLTLTRRNMQYRDDRLVVEGRIGHVAVQVDFDITETTIAVTCHLVQFTVAGESIMPKTPKYEPGKWKSWEYSRPTFDSEKQAVTWGMGQVARLHSAFGVKPDAPATCVHYEDQSIGIYTFVEEKIAVELDIKPSVKVADLVTEWTCTGIHAHL